MEYLEVEVAKLRESPYQTRVIAPDDPTIAELAESLKAHGVVQPVVVRVVRDGEYELIAGHRRATAARVAGLATVPARVIEATDREASELCVTENLQRKNLTPMEEAAGVHALLSAGHSAKEVGARLGRSAYWVSSRRAIASLPDDLKADEKVRACGVDALVEIAKAAAAFGADAARNCVGYFHASPDGGAVRRWVDDKYLRDLDKAPFSDMTRCKDCAKRTACMLDLFEDPEQGLGRCMDPKCYEQRKLEQRQIDLDEFFATDPEDLGDVEKRYISSYDIRGLKIPDGVTPTSYVYLRPDDDEVLKGAPEDYVRAVFYSMQYDSQLDKYVWVWRVGWDYCPDRNLSDEDLADRAAREREEEIASEAKRRLDERVKDDCRQWAKLAARGEASVPPVMRNAGEVISPHGVLQFLGLCAVCGGRVDFEADGADESGAVCDHLNGKLLSDCVGADELEAALRNIFEANRCFVAEVDEAGDADIVALHDALMLCVYGECWRDTLEAISYEIRSQVEAEKESADDGEEDE